MEVITYSFFINGEICLDVRTSKYRQDIVEIIITDFEFKPWREVILKKYELTELFSKFKRFYKNPPNIHSYSFKSLFDKLLKKLNITYFEKDKFIIENSTQQVTISEFAVYKLLQIEADIYKVISQIEQKSPIFNGIEIFNLIKYE